VTNGRPLWPLVYYSLRSGDMGAAVRYLKEAGTCPDLLKLMTLLKMGDRDPSTAKLEGQLKLEYNNKLHVCTDPYKKAVSTWVSIGLSHQHYKIPVSIRYTSSCWPAILTIRTWN